jgi:hypothetical protein
MTMAANKGSIGTGRAKRGGAVNVITGNIISRDALSGRFSVVKTSGVGGSVKKVSSKADSLAISSGKRNEGSFTVNKKKAEQAEQAVLSYLNKSNN